MSQNETPYYQLQLSALAFGAEPVKRLRHIVDWCIVEVGNGEAAKMNKSELREAADELARKSWPGGVAVTRTDHLAVVVGMRLLGVSGGDVRCTIESAQLIGEFIRQTAATDGRAPYVRMRSDFVWDCIHGNMRYRDFSVLAAVYCELGASAYRRITREQIRAAAMGYKSWRIMTPERLSNREDKAEPLSIDQVRYTLDALEGRSLFARVQLSPRRTYFSNRMDRDALSEKLAEWAIKRQTKTKTHRQADAALRERIRAACIVVGKGSRKSPRSPRIIPASSPRIPHEFPTATETVL